MGCAKIDKSVDVGISQNNFKVMSDAARETRSNKHGPHTIPHNSQVSVVGTSHGSSSLKLFEEKPKMLLACTGPKCPSDVIVVSKLSVRARKARMYLGMMRQATSDKAFYYAAAEYRKIEMGLTPIELVHDVRIYFQMIRQNSSSSREYKFAETMFRKNIFRLATSAMSNWAAPLWKMIRGGYLVGSKEYAFAVAMYRQVKAKLPCVALASRAQAELEMIRSNSIGSVRYKFAVAEYLKTLHRLSPHLLSQQSEVLDGLLQKAVELGDNKAILYDKTKREIGRLLRRTKTRSRS